MDARWRKLRALIPAALAARMDNVNAFTHAQITGDDPVRAFQGWLDEAMRQLVLGINGSWMLSYVRNAGDMALLRATTFNKDAEDESLLKVDRVPQLQVLAHTELQGICEALSQKAVRALANGLLTKQAQPAIARTIQALIDTVGKRRSAMLISFICVRTFGAVTLDSFRAAGLTHVGTVAERTGSKLAPSSHGLVRDAKRTRSRSRRRRDAAFAAPEELVEVLTAGDDKVCQECEDISDDGPYTLDDAEELIPAHPNCRCAFVPWDDDRFADVHAEDAGFDEDKHPRDDHGRWTNGDSFSDDEHQALTDYAIDWTLNNKLRDGEQLDAEEKQTMKNMDSAILKHKFTSDQTLYRGVSERMGARYAKMDMGQITRYPGFLSTTKDEGVSKEFGPTKMEIQVPAGANGIDMEHIYKGGDVNGPEAEKEVILGRQTRLEYRGRGRNGSYQFRLLK